jgi:alkylhydroperoxidase family enzyme
LSANSCPDAIGSSAQLSRLWYAAARVARLMKEIEWGEPVVQLVDDPEWTAEIKRTLGPKALAFRYLGPSKWLRELALRGSSGRNSYADERISMLASLVTAQENSCRFCYGAARAFLKMIGLSDKEIDEVEHDVKTAGADEKERELLHFCRDLSRSNPRPSRAQVERLVSLGYEPLAMVEIAFTVAGACLSNRLATFLALPVSTDMEEFKPTLMMRLMMRGKRLFNPLPPPPPRENLPPDEYPFSEVVALLKGTNGVPMVHDALVGAFASPVLPVRTKAWIFAVVARALDCGMCERIATKLLEREGVPAEVHARVLSALSGPELDETEKILLPWVRETAHYQTEVMQRKTRELGKRVGDDVVLEAIGLAAMANACARISMLAQ